MTSEIKPLSKDEVIRRLRDLENAKVGGPGPDWLFVPPNRWGPPLSALARDAANLLENGS